MRIRVALIDDQTLVREGIRGLLSLSDQVSVVAEGNDGAAAVEIAVEHAPDVFLMDIRMPRVNGIEAIRHLREQAIDTPVLILTTFDDHDLVMQGIAAGATVVQPGLTQALIDHVKVRGVTFESSAIPDALTPRETEILRLMASGCSNREISQILNNSEGTVKNHVSNILAKLGVRDRTRAVLKAIAAGVC